LRDEPTAPLGGDAKGRKLAMLAHANARIQLTVVAGSGSI
jgi:hypothetical protein